jgi:pullulanase
LKTKNTDVIDYVKALIKMRKEHPAFRMTTTKQIAANIHFADAPKRVVSYTINGAAVKDKWNKIFVVYNGNVNEMKIDLPTGKWQKISLPGQSLYPHKSEHSIIVSAYSCTILYQQKI